MTTTSRGSIDERIALRVQALQLARRRGNTRQGAWAASRLRLPGVTLDPADSRWARDARVRFGRALRAARARSAAAPLEDVAIAPGATRVRSRSRWIAAALAGAIVILAVLFLTRAPNDDQAQPAGGGRPQAAGAAATASPLRGRSDQIAVVIPVPTATPEPTATPVESTTPAPTTAPIGRPGGSTGSTGSAGTGGTGGGTGGGNGTGNGTGSGTATPAPTPRPTPAPTAPDPQTTMILRGRVIDGNTTLGIPQVCVAPGLIQCQGQTVRFTDNDGNWELVLSIGQVWDIRFIKPGYGTQEIKVPSSPGIHYVPTIRMYPLR